MSKNYFVIMTGWVKFQPREFEPIVKLKELKKNICMTNDIELMVNKSGIQENEITGRITKRGVVRPTGVEREVAVITPAYQFKVNLENQRLTEYRQETLWNTRNILDYFAFRKFQIVVVDGSLPILIYRGNIVGSLQDSYVPTCGDYAAKRYNFKLMNSTVFVTNKAKDLLSYDVGSLESDESCEAAIIKSKVATGVANYIIEGKRVLILTTKGLFMKLGWKNSHPLHRERGSPRINLEYLEFAMIGKSKLIAIYRDGVSDTIFCANYSLKTNKELSRIALDTRSDSTPEIHALPVNKTYLVSYYKDSKSEIVSCSRNTIALVCSIPWVFKTTEVHPYIQIEKDQVAIYRSPFLNLVANYIIF